MGNQPQPQWDAGWEAHELRQLQETAKVPLIKKLRWLEEAQRVALSLAESRKRQQEAKNADPKPNVT